VNLTLQQNQMQQRMNSVEALVATVEGHVLVLGAQLLERLPPKRRVEDFSMQLRSAKKRRS
jgi:hypothetical protein